MKRYPIVLIILCLLALQNHAAAQTKDLFEVCRKGDTAALKKMLQLDSLLVNQQQSSGFTPLIIATYNGQTAIAKILLDNGAAINAQDRSGNTALMGLCFNGNIELVKLLISYKVSINQLNFNHASALVFAATFGHAEIVSLLLKAGADKTIKDNSGKTALDQALMQGNDVVVKLLQ